MCIRDSYGIEEDEIAVYGDGGNDLVMLRRFRHSYATANGSPCLLYTSAEEAAEVSAAESAADGE